MNWRKNFGILLIVMFVLNLVLSGINMDIHAACGWFCALLAQMKLFFNYGDY